MSRSGDASLHTSGVATISTHHAFGAFLAILVTPSFAGPCDKPVGDLLKSFNSGDYEATVDIATDMMNDSESAKCASLFVTRGRALMSLGQLKNAVQDLEKSVELNPISCFTNTFLALAYIEQERAGIPDSGLISCLEREPTNRDALYILSSVYWVNENYDAALEVFESIVESAPGDIVALVSQASALRKAKKYRQAEERLNDILGKNPSFAFAHEEMGQLLFAQEKFQDSIRWFTNSIDLSIAANEYPELIASEYNSRAMARLEIGDIDEAFEDVAQSLVHFESAGAYLTLAKLRRNIDQLNEACQSLEKAIGFDPDKDDRVEIRGLLLRCR